MRVMIAKGPLGHQNADRHQCEADKTRAEAGGVDSDQKLHPVFGFLAFGRVFFELERHAHRITKADETEHSQNRTCVNHICKDIFHAGYVGGRAAFGKLGLAPYSASG